MAALAQQPTRGISYGRNRVRRCVIIGAGTAGRTLARDLRRSPELGLAPIGFLDDRLGRRRRAVGGLPVLGTTADLHRVALAHGIEAVVVAIPSLQGRDIRRLASLAAAEGLSVRYLPSFGDALERVARVGDLQHLQIDRLLARHEHHVVRQASREVIAGKHVLVTGAGGSIGSEICAQIRAFGPRALSFVDHDETNLHSLKLELDGESRLDTTDVIIADIKDRTRIEQVFADRRPDVVFHAAAHKHLPLIERHPCEGVKANVLGTQILVEAALAVGVERFVLISTDKAADPTSMLGATKRVAEMILSQHATDETRFASVRFGNVLGSRGSFVPVLAEQIENHEPVTITHPDVQRFFMTIEEAAGLVIEAAAMAEFGEVFVLDMGEPVRIVDLVENYASQIHLDAGEVKIEFTGLRPGEKVSEELFGAAEDQSPTAHPKIWAARSRASVSDFDRRLADLVAAAQQNEADEVRRCMGLLLPGFEPAPTGPLAHSVDSHYPDGF